MELKNRVVHSKITIIFQGKQKKTLFYRKLEPPTECA